ncbi:MAG TPA: flagellar basal body rod C-terminal domain-containing protein, partial [Pseudoduganella sp.]
GAPNYSEPGKGVAGSLSVTTLEQSNVDITSELVSLMTSQRNYQANSKVITTENQMLQSLMQAL